jgi:hypothetical protein
MINNTNCTLPGSCGEDFVHLINDTNTDGCFKLKGRDTCNGVKQCAWSTCPFILGTCSPLEDCRDLDMPGCVCDKDPEDKPLPENKTDVDGKNQTNESNHTIPEKKASSMLDCS